MPGTFGLIGKVYLMGAGPGAADLLTVRALNVLKQAEVVLHDELVSQEVLDCVPTSSQVLNVGKRCGQHSVKQEEIHDRMIKFARQGRTVVRLKGGDPLIFGRAQEEMQALREAGIAFEIIPGVTAALAAAAAAKIPLTERRSASKLLFVSNHQSEQKTALNGTAATGWRTNVASETTLVFYMPGRDFHELVRELRGSGFASDTPCLMVSNASRAEQQFFRTTLSELSEAAPLPAPSLLIVGSMVQEFPDGRQEDAGHKDLDIQLEEVLALGDRPETVRVEESSAVPEQAWQEDIVYRLLPHSSRENYE